MASSGGHLLSSTAAEPGLMSKLGRGMIMMALWQVWILLGFWRRKQQSLNLEGESWNSHKSRGHVP